MRRGGAPTSMTLSDSVYERLLQSGSSCWASRSTTTSPTGSAAQMLLLAAEDPTTDIDLYINSPGGSVTAGMAIFDTMEFIPCDVATYAMGLAASMGQFLLSAGTKGKRYALPHCRILMHQPSAGVGGTRADIAIQAELFRRHKKEMAQLIAEPHRPDRSSGSRRLRPRPLVLRAGGAGVRLRRPRHLARRPAARRDQRERERERPMSYQPQPQSRYVLPSFVEHTSYGVKESNPYNKLFEERIIFLGVQVDDASANDVMAQLLVPGVADPDRDISMYINSPGGSFTSLMAIYDTMQYVRARHPDRVPRPGRVGRRGAAGRGHPRQAARRCRTRASSSTSPRSEGDLRAGLRPGDPGRRDRAHAHAAGVRRWPSTPARARSRCGTTSSATRSSRPRRPRSTGSSTRSSRVASSRPSRVSAVRRHRRSRGARCSPRGGSSGYRHEVRAPCAPDGTGVCTHGTHRRWR